MDEEKFRIRLPDNVKSELIELLDKSAAEDIIQLASHFVSRIDHSTTPRSIRQRVAYTNALIPYAKKLLMVISDAEVQDHILQRSAAYTDAGRATLEPFTDQDKLVDLISALRNLEGAIDLSAIKNTNKRYDVQGRLFLYDLAEIIKDVNGGSITRKKPEGGHPLNLLSVTVEMIRPTLKQYVEMIRPTLKQYNRTVGASLVSAVSAKITSKTKE